MNRTGIIIAPSILAADFSDIKGELAKVHDSGASWLHLDVMDGSFVPEITFGAQFIRDIRKRSGLYFDAHLMIEKPQNHIEKFAEAGCQSITVHSEGASHLEKTLEMIKQYGVKAGVAINPSTPVSLIEPVLDLVDLVLVMSVNPGYGGQELIPETLKKVSELVKLRKDRSYLISIDGGVNDKTIEAVAQSGVDIAVTGSAFFKSEDPAGLVRRYSNILGENNG